MSDSNDYMNISASTDRVKAAALEPNCSLIDVQTRPKAKISNNCVVITPDAVATVAGMRCLIAAGDLQGALHLLEQSAKRMERAGNSETAAAMLRLADAITSIHPSDKALPLRA